MAPFFGSWNQGLKKKNPCDKKQTPAALKFP
jgi:hypothetical protein